MPDQIANRPPQQSKTIFKVDSPYSAVSWPGLSTTQESTVLELLSTYVSPIGQHRAHHVTPSKGARARKRKLLEDTKREKTAESAVGNTVVPAPPDLQAHVLVGLNQVTRYLEALAATNRPLSLSASIASTTTTKPSGTETSSSPGENVEQSKNSKSLSSHVAAVFVLRPQSRKTIIYNHLPLLTLTASNAHPSLARTRLVSFERTAAAAETRLVTALGVPRVGVIAILQSAPHAEFLLDYVRENVGDVEIPWLEDTLNGNYNMLNVKVEETLSKDNKSKNGEKDKN